MKIYDDIDAIMQNVKSLTAEAERLERIIDDYCELFEEIDQVAGRSNGKTAVKISKLLDNFAGI
jgi:prefoldin subunit 5